jgi:hypothetical protein
MIRSTNALAVLMTLSMTATTAFSMVDAPREIVVDKDGMPICLVDIDNRGYVKFLWNQDSYVRPILATGESYKSKTERAFRSLVQTECSADRSWLKTPSSELKEPTLTIGGDVYDLLAPEATSYTIKGTNHTIGFSAEVMKRLSQVRLGGNVVRGDDILTPAQYVKKFSIRDYDKTLNRELAFKYGSGFSGDVYKEVLMAKPENAKMLKDTMANMKRYTTDKKFATEVSARFKGMTFVLIKGFAHERDNDERISPVYKVLRSYGFETLDFKTNPYGRTEDNALLVANQLEAALKQGKNLIIASGSAATTQAFGALAILNQRYNGKINSSLPGKIEAYMNLSGVVGGAFAPEAIGSNRLIWKFARNKISDVLFGSESGLEELKAKINSLPSPKKELMSPEIAKYEERMKYKADPIYLESFRDLSVSRVSYFMEDVFPNLPNDVVYFNLVGVNAKNGIVTDPSMNYLQTKYVRGDYAKFFRSVGANDGYVEYPGTELNKEMVPGGQIFSLVFNSSHVILDGALEQYPLLKNYENQRGVIGSVIMTLGDKLGL